MPVLVTALRGKRVVTIDANWKQSVAVLDTGELFAWGWNRNGELGLGDDADRNVPTQVMALAGRRVGTVACGEHHTAAALGAPSAFVDVIAYNHHSISLTRT